jgi:hypothetical protein
MIFPSLFYPRDISWPAQKTDNTDASLPQGGSPHFDGKIHLFDLDGNFVKRMQMDYPILECVALKDKKVGISGSVPYKGKQSKKLIAIKDVNTETEDILTYYMEDYSDRIIKELSERPIKFPEHMPYYYNLIVDSDGNILIFFYTKTNDIYRFQVYSPDGAYICESAIDPGEYKLKVYRNLIPIAFFKGDLFAFVSGKDNPSVPPRLIKVNLSENN